MKHLVEFKLPDDSKILIETDDNLIPVGPLRVAKKPDQLATEARQTFEKSIETIRPMASTLLTKLHEMAEPADEIEVKFGLKLTAEAGAIIASTGGEVNFDITLKWKRNP